MVGTIGQVGTVAGNGTNGTAVVTNAGNFNIGGVVAASALLITSAVETASVVANKKNLAEMIGESDAKAIGKLNTVAAGVLAAMDAKNLYDTYTNTGEVNLKDALSFAGNALAVGAGIAMMSNPFGLAVGAFALASVAFAGASIAADKDTDLINHGAERGQEFGRRVEDALTNIKEKANDIALGKPIQDFFDTQVQDAVDSMLKNREKLGELVDKIKDEITNSENHSPTKLLEKLLTPIMEFGINLSKEGDELSKEMEDLAEKIKDTLKDILDKIADINLPNPFDDLADDLAEAFAKWAGINRSGFHYFYDPIVLDLDGDGIETIAHDKLNKAVFDHDGDGIAHATGWVKKDDGILVLDRNGDGMINDGREVFGDSTILSSGQIAKHGYEALADLDSDGNGKINADDTKFNELRIWRDLDSDGVSDVGELFGLDELGISALNLTYQEVDRNLAGGNKLTQLGSYEKYDGKTGIMGDVNFNFHGVYTKHLGGVANTDDRLPNLQGAGRVRSLNEAMMLSDELKNIVINYLNAKSKDEQLSMMDGLLKAWAKTDPEYQDYEKPIFLSMGTSRSQKGAVGVAGGGRGMIDLMGMAEFDKIKYKIGVLDSFMGTKTDDMFYANVKDFEGTTKIINDTYDKLIKSVYSGLYPQTVQHRYGDLIDIVVDVKDGNLLFGLDINRLVSDFKARLDVGGQTAMSDFGDIMEYFAYLQAQKQSNIVGRDKLVDLIEYVVSIVPKHELDGWINSIDFKIDRELPIKIGDAQDNHLQGSILFAGAGNDFLNGGAGDDLLFGQDGNDRLIGGNGDDILNGGAGDDYLSNSGRNNGHDTYIFSGDYGNDIIHDSDLNVSQERHQDTIRFTDVNLSAVQVLLKGQDLILKTSDSNSVTIQNFQHGDQYYIENLEFADQTVSLAELMATKVAAYHGTDGGDSYNTGHWKAQSIAHLGAGNDIFNATGGKTEVYGQDGDDRVTTGTGNDVLDGGNGSDTLNSGNGDDILNGGAGDDYLSNSGRNNGHDTYIFSGDYGNDIIHDSDLNVSQERHQDTIRFTDVNLSAVQVLLKGQDLILKTSDSNSVTIQNFQHGDQYYIENLEFADQTVSLAELMATKVAAYHGTDGGDSYNTGHWKAQSIAHLGAGNDIFNATGGKTEVYGQDGDDRVTTGTGNDVLDGGNGNDSLSGGIGNDLLFGQDGNDFLNGGAGDDLLNGGAGDDSLWGGVGADTFVFSLDKGLMVDITQIGFDHITDFNLSQGDKINLAGLFDNELTLDNFSDYVYFEKSAPKNITMMIDVDGKNNAFDKVAIANIYSNNIGDMISKLNQGEGLIL